MREGLCYETSASWACSSEDSHKRLQDAICNCFCDHQLAKEHLYMDRAVPDAQHPSSGCNQVSHTQHRLDYSGYSYRIAGICLHASIDKA